MVFEFKRKKFRKSLALSRNSKSFFPSSNRHFLSFVEKDKMGSIVC